MSDFLVIGGGIAGVSAAARLAPYGKVTLFEAEGHLGYHASGRSAALYERQYGKPTTVALSHASGDEFHGTEGWLAPRGFLLLGRNGEEDVFDADCKTMTLHEISMDEARAMLPLIGPEVTRAAWHEDAWDIDTGRMIQDYARTVTRHGGRIVTGAQITRIERTRQGWTLHTGKGDIHGGTVLVNAAGAWADEVARMARVTPLGLQPMRRSMGRIPAPEGHDVSRWPMIFGPGETWYAKPDAGALIVSPAEETPVDPHDAYAEDLTLAEGFQRFENYVDIPVTRLLSSWAGLRTFSPDRQLVLGPAPGDPAFVWCAAQGGYGFQTAPAASRLLAQLVTGQTPDLDADLVARLSPARFH